MSENESEQQKAIEAEFREYIRGDLPNQDDDPDAHPWTGIVQDRQLRDVLAFAEAHYQPLTANAPRSFEETDVVRRITRDHGTHTGTDALAAGNLGQLSYFSGLVSYKKDVSGMKVLMSLQSMIENIPVFIGYIYGLMGSGKTDFAFLLLEVFASIYGRDSVYMAANVSSDDLDEEIDHYSRIVDLLEERRERIQAGESLDPFVIVIDEAAQIFSGSGADQHRAKQLAKLLKLARKSNANIILIGQDGKDIDASLRALCTVFIEKQSQKKAVFWQDVKDRQGINEMMSLSGIPPTNYDFSTWDEGDFVFDDDGDDEDLPTEEDIRDLERQHEREMMALLAVSTDMTQAEIGDVYGVSEKTVRRAKRDHDDKLRDLGLLD
ncbi:zonular occludens toxin domain-containing protein [Halorussus salinisoli]|uniref:zonular occludens toxin domain-containing protein n=1 Tax=Halorussus salinisoli TaxID=2558242 RepID=UPI0010C23687|nr:zonular occludens toxin domain-containing protein [Halorussus salinisoli]